MRNCPKCNGIGAVDSEGKPFVKGVPRGVIHFLCDRCGGKPIEYVSDEDESAADDTDDVPYLVASDRGHEKRESPDPIV
jgi:hypothetical protein